MQDLHSVMTRDEATQQFEEFVLPYILETYEQDGRPDWAARREEWNNWTDGLCKEGIISDWQYNNWTHPDCCLIHRTPALTPRTWRVSTALFSQCIMLARSPPFKANSRGLKKIN